MYEKYIDYTNLKPDASDADIERLCNEAKAAGCASVCVNPCHIHLVKSLLQGSPVKICTVVGFPLGATFATVKVAETKQAISYGAEEIDMVINIGRVKSARYRHVRDEIKAVADVCHKHNVVLKVIIETCLLTEDEKRQVIQIVATSGADFVKTSTGFSTGGATVEDIKLMKEIVGDNIKIKASGGVRDAEFAKKLIKAGASRIGSSKLF